MASTYLSKTLGTPTLATKATCSLWFKRAKPDAHGSIIFGNNNGGGIFLHSSGFIDVYNADSSHLRTNRLFRDVSAWYHLVVAIDTTQSTASNRVKIYVNGVQETSFATNNYPNQNSSSLLGNNTAHNIGRNNTGSNFFDGYLSHFHFIDGTAYDASTFGSTDATTGEWKINTSPSVTYGNNGFFILKDGNSVTDQSPNTNNFTVSGGTLTKSEDCPSNVFATLNPLIVNRLDNNNTLSYGNNRQTTVSISGSYVASPSTLGMTSGKYYAEMKVTTLASNCFVGIDGQAVYTATQGINMGYSPYGYCYAQWGGKYNNGTSVSGAGNTFTTGDIIGIAVDMDNLKVYFSKNGVWQNSGDPTSGSTGTGAFYTIAAVDTLSEGAYYFEATNNDADGASIWDWNFGNGYFGTTAVSSAGTNASGIGIFEYDVPTGYTALSTKGLNL